MTDELDSLGLITTSPTIPVSVEFAFFRIA